MRIWILLLCALCLVGATLSSSVTSNVAIRSVGFSPAVDTISVHDVVRWTNQDGVTHNSSSKSGSSDTWDSGDLSPGATYSHQFNLTGTFRYQDTQSGVQGTIVVISQSPVRSSSWGRLKQLFHSKGRVIRS